MPGQFSLEEFYDTFPRIEDDFQAALDLSLGPRGSERLYDLVSDLRLPPGASVLDAGCGQGRHALALAERFGFRVTGIDPVPRHIRLAEERYRAAVDDHPDLSGRVSFARGVAEAVPLDDASVDLVWCRDVLAHVAALDRAYAEFRRVVRADGRVLVYQSSFRTDRLDEREATGLWETSGVVPSSAEPERTEAAIAAAGLRVEKRFDVGIEWAEASEERNGTATRRLLHAARLLRAPRHYIDRFGRPAYDIMLGDCLWHVYHMLGKLDSRVYLLARM